MADTDDLEIHEPERLVLSDLVNRVLDKGVVVTSQITIAIADIELVQLDLRLLISSVATLERRGREAETRGDLPPRSAAGE